MGIVNKNLNKIKRALIGLTQRMIIMEEKKKNWDRMQENLKPINEEMTTICESQTALQTEYRKIIGRIGSGS